MILNSFQEDRLPGIFKFDLQPDSYHLYQQKEGADLGEQIVTISPLLVLRHYSNFCYWLLGPSFFIGAIEMIYPVEVLWKRFVDAGSCELFKDRWPLEKGVKSQSCANCNTPAEFEGLPSSYGGYDLYCKVCGHTWHVK